MVIDVDKLREDMRSECLGAAFGGGFGGALVEEITGKRKEAKKF